jgi:hypothetical protein
MPFFAVYVVDPEIIEKFFLKNIRVLEVGGKVFTVVVVIFCVASEDDDVVAGFPNE